jgi:tetratricopeptide (TPR) repeat protein
MKKLLLVACLFATIYTKAQLTTLPSGGNKPAAVSEQVGLTKVTIHYDRPAVKGREGKIWGQLVPIGFTDQGFGNTKTAPWRAGANENTTISFSTDVQVEGQPLAAGKYGLFIAYDAAESMLIFSKNSNSWGSYYYNPAEDALRIKIKPQALNQSIEWLQYQFTNQTGNSATICMQWEKLSFPFTVSVDIKQTQVASFRNELRTEKGFTWQAWEQAAQWCMQNDTNLEEALLWADSATSTTFGGNFDFQPHSTKAMLLDKLGRADEATAVLKTALPLANMQEMHQYGRRLLNQKKAKEALEIFKTNYTKNPNQFTTLMGLTRGYAANADYKNALKYAQQALALAPDANNRNFVESAITKLKEGKDIN